MAASLACFSPHPGQNIEPLTGEDVQKLVEDIVATPRDLVDRVKRYIGQ